MQLLSYYTLYNTKVYDKNLNRLENMMILKLYIIMTNN